MVRMQESTPEERLQQVLQETCDKYEGFTLYVQGWTRKTFDVYYKPKRLESGEHMVRVESLATTNGEVRYFADRARDLAVDVAERIEQEFGLSEAVVRRERAPHTY